MKHVHLRHEKNCLNCGKIVEDRFCPHCGQENTEPRETFKHLVAHFFADETHYDSKLFITVKDLLLRPGFLTLQYNAGKRLSYLNPIRMYIFISAMFFLVMFSHKKEENKPNEDVTPKHGVNVFRQHLADSLRGEIKAKPKLLKDSVHNGLLARLAATLDTTKISSPVAESLAAAFNDKGEMVFNITENKYKTIVQYEEAQNKLAGKAKDDAVSAYISKKVIRLSHETGHNGEVTVTRDVAEDIPKLMFVLLPVFALFLSLFYSRKKYLFSQHAIFSLHFHSFVFLTFLAVYLIFHIFPGMTILSILSGITMLGIFIYLAVALHNAYHEKLWLSAIKAVGLSFCYVFAVFIANLVLFAVGFALI